MTYLNPQTPGKTRRGGNSNYNPEDQHPQIYIFVPILQHNQNIHICLYFMKANFKKHVNYLNVIFDINENNILTEDEIWTCVSNLAKSM
jgi:hypothetical protein